MLFSGSNFLYHDFEHKSTADIGAFCAGCLTCGGVKLLGAFHEPSRNLLIGCCLTFGGVKLLTSKRDRRKTPPDALLASEEAALPISEN